MTSVIVRVLDRDFNVFRVPIYVVDVSIALTEHWRHSWRVVHGREGVW